MRRSSLLWRSLRTKVGQAKSRQLRSARRSKQGASRRLRLEDLEDRRLLAITVTSTGDGQVDDTHVAPGTLRQAIYDANHTAGADTINFAVSNIVLTQGELDVYESVSIEGPAGSTVVIDGSDQQIFHVDNVGFTSPQTVSFSNLTLQNAGSSAVDGGAIFADNQNNLIVDHVNFENNDARYGGAIFLEQGATLNVQHSQFTGNSGSAISDLHISPAGSVTIDDCDFTQNTANGPTDGVSSYGGAVNVECPLEVTSSRFVKNSATYGGGAINAAAGNGNVTITGSYFEGNHIAWTGDAQGGAVAATGYEVDITSSQFVGNYAPAGDSDSNNSPAGGGAYISATVADIENVDAYQNVSDRGGAIFLSANSATISDSRLGSEHPGWGNTARRDGGGIYLEGPTEEVVISHSEIRNNTAGQYGGGIGSTVFGDLAVYISKISLQDSVVADNSAGNSGGGISVIRTATYLGNGLDDGSALLKILRSTIQHNVATVSGGGVYADFSWNPNTSLDDMDFELLQVRDSTISGNTAYGADGITYEYSYGAGGGGIFLQTRSNRPSTITNSTISGNRALNGGGIYIHGEGSKSLVKFRSTTITENIAGPFTGGYADVNAPAESSEKQYTAGGGMLFTGVANAAPEDMPSFENTILAGNTHHQDEPDPPKNFSAFDRSPDIGVFPLLFTYHGFPPTDPLYTFYADYTAIGDPGAQLDADGPGSTHTYPEYPYYNLYYLVTHTTIYGGTPDLSPLGAYGGPTKTQVPLDSGAIGKGDPSYGNHDTVIYSDPAETLPYDQRGTSSSGTFYRVVGTLDIGAVESQSPSPPVALLLGDYNNNGVVDAADYVIYRKYFGQNYQLPNEDPTVSPGKVTYGDYLVWREHFGDTLAFHAASALAVLPGDYNHDGIVNNDDQDVWQANFGSTTNLDADGDGNGIVDLGDLKILQGMFGVTTLTLIPGDFNKDGIVDQADHKLWEDGDLKADADGDHDVDGDDLTMWENHLGWTDAGMLPIITGDTGKPAVNISGQAPQVTGVQVGRSGLLGASFDFASVVGSGAQLQTVPVGGVNTVSISFSEEVFVTQNSLELVGLNHAATPDVVGFTYDLNTQTATWQFEDPLPADQYLIRLSDSVYDLSHDALDGEFTNPWSVAEPSGYASTMPSGDGHAGGEFRFRFTNLPGDFSGNNFVDGIDFLTWQSHVGTTIGCTQGHGDADGDGDIDTADFNSWYTTAGTEYTRWPSVEPGMILVSKATDESDSDYSYGDLSLREALAIAHATPGTDTIVFDPSITTIDLTLGELDIDSDVIIQGSGTHSLTIDAQGDSRVLYVDWGKTVSISGLTLTGGGDTDYGAGIFNYGGDLTLQNVTISGNSASDNGGGIYSRYGSLHLVDSTIDGNSAAFNAGVGFYTFSGGAVGDTLQISGSTISDNTGTYIGGLGVFGGAGDAQFTMTNSTLSTNSATSGVGGMQVDWGAHFVVVNSTITKNSGYDVGGVFVNDSGSVLTLYNSIIAKNISSTWSGFNEDVGRNAGIFDTASSYNLIGKEGWSGITGTTTNHNQVGTQSSPIDPHLAPLGDYGGPTQTHALLTTSDAIDAGGDSYVSDFGLETDQRGGNSRVAGAHVDIGAFEAGNAIIVTILSDEYDGDYTANDLSLREALSLAAAIPGADVIRFADTLFDEGAATIALTDTLGINSDVSIIGPGTNLLTIDGQGTIAGVSTGAWTDYISDLTIANCFSADGGAGITASNTDLTLERVTVTGGFSVNVGGVSTSGGTLAIIDSAIEGNTGYWVGGIEAGGTSLTVRNCSISGNWGWSVGGLLDAAGSAVVVNSTISGNTGYLTGSVGGVKAYDSGGTLVLVNNTITNNTGSSTGGLFIQGGYGHVTLANTIIAGNYDALYGDNDIAIDDSTAVEVVATHNLIGYDPTTGDNFNLDNGVNGNIVGGEGTDPPKDAHLTAMAFHDGGLTATHALLDNSDAIGAGDDSYAEMYDLVYDQRGMGHDRLVGAIDIGAFELGLGESYGT